MQGVWWEESKLPPSAWRRGQQSLHVLAIVKEVLWDWDSKLAGRPCVSEHSDEVLMDTLPVGLLDNSVDLSEAVAV